MSRQSDHTVLAAARAELTAAYTLVADPQCHNTTAMPHLRRAWEAVSTVSKGYPPDAAGSTLRDWLGDAHLKAIPTKQQGTVHGTLMSVHGFSRDPKPWDEATNGARVPGNKALFANMRALSSLIEVMTVEQQGEEPVTTIGLRWAKRAAIWGGIGVAFLLVALRPWQRDDIGPWRAACSSSIISRASSRVAPGSMAKLPVTLPHSGALKKRQPTSPFMKRDAAWLRPRMVSASTG